MASYRIKQEHSEAVVMTKQQAELCIRKLDYLIHLIGSNSKNTFAIRLLSDCSARLNEVLNNLDDEKCNLSESLKPLSNLEIIKEVISFGLQDNLALLDLEIVQWLDIDSVMNKLCTDFTRQTEKQLALLETNTVTVECQINIDRALKRCLKAQPYIVVTKVKDSFRFTFERTGIHRYIFQQIYSLLLKELDTNQIELSIVEGKDSFTTELIESCYQVQNQRSVIDFNKESVLERIKNLFFLYDVCQKVWVKEEEDKVKAINEQLIGVDSELQSAKSHFYERCGKRFNLSRELVKNDETLLETQFPKKPYKLIDSSIDIDLLNTINETSTLIYQKKVWQLKTQTQLIQKQSELDIVYSETSKLIEIGRDVFVAFKEYNEQVAIKYCERKESNCLYHQLKEANQGIDNKSSLAELLLVIETLYKTSLQQLGIDIANLIKENYLLITEPIASAINSVQKQFTSYPYEGNNIYYHTARLIFIECKSIAELSLMDILVGRSNPSQKIDEELSQLFKKEQYVNDINFIYQLGLELLKGKGCLSALIIHQNHHDNFSSHQNEEYISALRNHGDYQLMCHLNELSSDLKSHEISDGTILEFFGHKIGLSKEIHALILLLDKLHYLNDSPSKKKRIEEFCASLLSESRASILREKIQEGQSSAQTITDISDVFIDDLLEEMGGNAVLSRLKTLYQLKVKYINDHEFIYQYHEVDLGDIKVVTGLELFNKLTLSDTDDVVFIEEIITLKGNELTVPKKLVKKYQLDNEQLYLHDPMAFRSNLINKLIVNQLDIHQGAKPNQRAALYTHLQKNDNGQYLAFFSFFKISMPNIEDSYKQELDELIKAEVKRNITIIKTNLNQIGYESLIEYLKNNLETIELVWTIHTLKQFIEDIIYQINQCYSPKRLLEKLSEIVSNGENDEISALKEIVAEISDLSLSYRLLNADIREGMINSKLIQSNFVQAKKLIAAVNLSLIEGNQQDIIEALEKNGLELSNTSLSPWIKHVPNSDCYYSTISSDYQELFAGTQSLRGLCEVDDLITYSLYLQSLMDRQDGFDVCCYRHKKSHIIRYVRLISHTAKDDKFQVSEALVGQARYAINLVLCFKLWMQDHFNKVEDIEHIERITVCIARGLMIRVNALLNGETDNHGDLVSYIQNTIIFYVINHQDKLSSNEQIDRLQSYMPVVLSMYHNIEHVTLHKQNDTQLISSIRPKETITQYQLQYHIAKDRYSILLLNRLNGALDISWDEPDLYAHINEKSHKLLKTLTDKDLENQLLLTLYYKPRDEEKIEISGRYEYQSDLVVKNIQQVLDDESIFHTEINLAPQFSQDDNQWQGLQSYLKAIDDRTEQLLSHLSPTTGQETFYRLLAIRYKVHIIKQRLNLEDSRGFISIESIKDNGLVELFANLFELNQLTTDIDKALPRELKYRSPLIIHYYNASACPSIIEDNFMSFLSDYVKQQYHNVISDVKSLGSIFDPLAADNMISPSYHEDIQQPQYNHFYQSPENYRTRKLVNHKIKKEQLIEHCNNYESVIYNDKRTNLSSLYSRYPHYLVNVSQLLAIRLTIEDSKLYFMLHNKKSLVYRFLEHEQMMLDDMRRLDIFSDNYNLLFANSIRQINDAIANYLNWFNYSTPTLHYYEHTDSPLNTKFRAYQKSDFQGAEPFCFLLSPKQRSLLNKELAIAYIDYLQKKDVTFSTQKLNKLKNYIRQTGFQLSVITESLDTNDYNLEQAISSQVEHPESVNDLVGLLFRLIVKENINKLYDINNELVIDEIERNFDNNTIDEIAKIALLSPQRKMGASLVRVLRKNFINRIRTLSFYSRHFDYHQQSILFEKLIANYKRKSIADPKHIRFSVQGRMIIDSSDTLPSEYNSLIDSEIKLRITLSDTESTTSLYDRYFSQPVSERLKNDARVPIQEILERKIIKLHRIFHHVYNREAGDYIVYKSSDWEAVLLKAFHLANHNWRDALIKFIKSHDSKSDSLSVDDWLMEYLMDSNQHVLEHLFQAMKIIDIDNEYYHFITAVDIIRQHISEEDIKQSAIEKIQLIDCDSESECFISINEAKLEDEAKDETPLCCRLYHYYPFYGESFLNNYTIRRLHYIDRKVGSTFSFDYFEKLINSINSNETNFTESVLVTYQLPMIKGSSSAGVFQNGSGLNIDRLLDPIFCFNAAQVKKGHVEQILFISFFCDYISLPKNMSSISSPGIKELLFIQKVTQLYVLNQYSFLFDNSNEISHLFDEVMRLYILFLKGYKSKSSGYLHLSNFGKQIEKRIHTFITNSPSSNKSSQSRSIQNLFAHLIYQYFVDNERCDKNSLTILQLAICFLQPVVLFKATDNFYSLIDVFGKVKMLTSCSYRFSSLDVSERQLLNALCAKIADQNISYDALVAIIDTVYSERYQSNTHRLFYHYVEEIKPCAEVDRQPDEMTTCLGDFNDFATELMSIDPNCLITSESPAVSIQYDYDVNLYNEAPYINLLSLCIFQSIQLYSLSVSTARPSKIAWCDLYADIFQESVNIYDSSFDCKSLNMLLLAINEYELIQPLLFDSTCKFVREYFQSATDCPNEDKLIDRFIQKNFETMFTDLLLSVDIIDGNECSKSFVVENNLCHFTLYQHNDVLSFSPTQGCVPLKNTLSSQHPLYESFDKLVKSQKQRSNAEFRIQLQDYVQYRYQCLHDDFFELKHSLILREKLYLNESEANELFQSQVIAKESSQYQQRHSYEVKSQRERERFKKIQSENADRFIIRSCFTKIFSKPLILDTEDINQHILETVTIIEIKQLTKQLSSLLFVVDPYEFIELQISLRRVLSFVEGKFQLVRDKINELYDVYIPGTKLYEAVSEHEEIVYKIEEELQENEKLANAMERVVDSLNHAIQTANDNRHKVNLISTKKYDVKRLNVRQVIEQRLLELHVDFSVFRDLSTLSPESLLEHRFTAADRASLSIFEQPDHQTFFISDNSTYSKEHFYELAFLLVTRLLINLEKAPKESFNINIQTTDESLALTIWGVYFIFYSNLKIQPATFMVNGVELSPKVPLIGAPAIVKEITAFFGKRRINYSLKVLKHIFDIKEKISGSKSLYKIYDALSKKSK